MYYMDLSRLSDEALLGKVQALAETERFNLVDLIIHLGELDTRDACQDRGYATVFAYLTRGLGYAESDAIRRVRTARAARSYPSILRMLAAGELNLVSVALLQPLLTSENHERLLRRAARRSTREVERMAADLSPAGAEPRDRIRALPAQTALKTGPPSGSMSLFEKAGGWEADFSSGAALPGKIPEPSEGARLEGPSAALLPEGGGSARGAGGPAASDGGPARLDAAAAAPVQRRVVFTFTASEEVQSWFEAARDLLRHRFPMGRMEEIIGEALRRLARDELPGESKLRRQGSAESRHIPKWVQDQVWRRDGGRCAFIGANGMRCGETAWLEFDHILPFAWGGPSNDPANIRLLCRSHNQSEQARIFGTPLENGPGLEI